MGCEHAWRGPHLIRAALCVQNAMNSVSFAQDASPFEPTFSASTLEACCVQKAKLQRSFCLSCVVQNAGNSARTNKAQGVLTDLLASPERKNASELRPLARELTRAGRQRCQLTPVDQHARCRLTSSVRRLASSGLATRLPARPIESRLYFPVCAPAVLLSVAARQGAPRKNASLWAPLHGGADVPGMVHDRERRRRGETV